MPTADTARFGAGGGEPYGAALVDAGRILTLHRSVFEHLPGLGRWGTAVLMDGNIGIGGDPTALLRRCVALAGLVLHREWASASRSFADYVRP